MFVDAPNFDYRPTAGSPLLEQGTATSSSPPGFPFPNPLALPTHEPPQQSVLPGSPAPARIVRGTIDIGAYEFPGSIFVDGWEIQSSSRWSAVAP